MKYTSGDVREAVGVRCSAELAGLSLSFVYLVIDSRTEQAKYETEHDKKRKKIPIPSSHVNLCEPAAPVLGGSLPRTRC